PYLVRGRRERRIRVHALRRMRLSATGRPYGASFPPPSKTYRRVGISRADPLVLAARPDQKSLQAEANRLKQTPGVGGGRSKIFKGDARGAERGQPFQNLDRHRRLPNRPMSSGVLAAPGIFRRDSGV